MLGGANLNELTHLMVEVSRNKGVSLVPPLAEEGYRISLALCVRSNEPGSQST